MIFRWLLLVGCLFLALLAQPGAAKKDKPHINKEKIDQLPSELSYIPGTDTVLYRNPSTGDLRCSFNGGESWETVKGDNGDMKGQVARFQPHMFDNNKAYALGIKGRHWITKDQAKTWEAFELPAVPAFENDPLSFHGWDSGKVLFHSEECLMDLLGRTMCIVSSYYTTDDFKTVKPLKKETYGCSWAVGHPQFAEDLDVAADIRTRVHCVVPGLKSPFGHANRLVYSDDFFGGNHEGTEVSLQEGRPVSGVMSAAPVKKYLVAAARSQGTDELALYVTDDAKTWHRAEFGNHRLEEGAYTVLESTNYSIQVDVLTPKREFNRMGVLFTSNSNGTYFTPNIQHTNRDRRNIVDFEKIADIQGIVLVNTVKNHEEVLKSKKPGSPKKQLVSKISFDDGRTFQPLKVGDKHLHVHSMTNLKNEGRVFSSPAPGIVMAVGNTGDHLKDYSEGNLFISDDAGVTWRHAQDGPHKYEFGDQGAVVVAVGDDGEKVDKIKFSIDHGKQWLSTELEHKIYPWVLTTTPDSTSLKFLLIGNEQKDLKGEFTIYSIDFNGLHERKCESSDFNPHWPARLDEKGNPDCLMGHKQFFRRRKADADCFVGEKFRNPQPIFEKCKCTAEDFECDYNFKRSEDRKSCEPAVPLKPKAGQCQKSGDKFMAPSGWRLIPGNVCIRDGGENLDKEIEHPCGDSVTVPTDGKPKAKSQSDFEGDMYAHYYYLERQASSSGDDETVIMTTTKGVTYITHDHGKTWNQPSALKGKKIVEVAPHNYVNDIAFFLTDSDEGYWTVDRGYSVKSFTAPTSRIPNDLQAKTGLTPLTFHSRYNDWLIWTGPVGCDGGSRDCHFDAHISKNRGEEWKVMRHYIRRCDFMAMEGRENSDNLIFCVQYQNENQDHDKQLVASDDFFDDKRVEFDKVEDFATMAEFIVVAAPDQNKTDSLQASASVDGRIFAGAEFPVNVNVPKSSYTVLESSSHAVFLHVTEKKMQGAHYGALIKSNSNGTSYVLSLSALYRDDKGYVDFEKMQNLEGVMVANVVSNVDVVDSKGASKKLKTMITHNDGAQWTLLAPPAKDAEGKAFGCSVTAGRGTDQCSLHLHGYTERDDPRDTLSSGSAIGLMISLGNVGDHLTSKSEADTFLTADGGITWKCIRKGRYMWEYGDAGSVIVVVPEAKATKVLHYSLDDGDTWNDFQFSDVEMDIKDISTVPSDTSKNFLLWGKDSSSSKFTTVNVDFSDIRSRTCVLDESHGENEDYYLWKPKHPLQDNHCLFGHVEQYQRKRPSAQCWNNWRGAHLHRIGENCTCTRTDYECDYNYEPQTDGSCALVPGLPKPDAIASCKADPDLVEYWEPTGYRRIPLTTCQGGLNLDQIVSKPCPSKEEEYRKRHGVSGLGLFFAIVIPLAAAGGVGYYVYTRWDGKFGQIRLGDNGSTTVEGLFSRDSPLLMVPIAVIAGIVAVAQALPLLAMSLWRSASGYTRLGRSRGYQRPYASRGSFAARRGDYTSVVDDEDELLGVVDAEGDDEEDL